MRKLLRILAWLTGISIVITLTVLVLVWLFFDPNNFKDQITRLVRAETGRELSIQGDIRMTLFPWLGVELERVEISNAAGFGSRPFAAARSAKVRARLLPLFRKQLEMDRIALAGLTLNLARDESGRSNWDDLVQGDDAQDSAFNPASLLQGGLDITDSRLVWSDARSGGRQTLDKLNVQLGAVRSGEEFAVTMGAMLTSAALTGPVEISATGSIDVARKRYQFLDSMIQAQLTGDALTSAELPGGKLAITLNSDISADLEQQTVQFASLNLQALGLALTGELQLSHFLDAPMLAGSVQLREFNPRDLLKQLGQALPVTADPTALSRATLMAELDVSAQGVNLNNLKFELDASSFSGNLEVAGFTSPAASFGLVLDTLDLDRYLSPQIMETSTAAVASMAVISTTGLGSSSALSALRGLDIKGTLKISSLKVKEVHSANALLSLDLAQQTFHLVSPQLEIMETSFKADIRGARIIDDAHFTGPISMSAFNPRDLLRKLGKELPVSSDSDVLKQATLSAQLDASQSHLTLRQLSLNLDDNLIRGDLTVKNFAAPTICVALSVDQLDLNRYLPAVTTPPSPGPTTAATSISLPLAALRALDLQGTLRITRLKVKDLTISDVLIRADDTAQVAGTGAQPAPRVAICP